MSLPRNEDVSLYEVVTTTEPSLATLQVSLTTFKTWIGATIDLLIDQKIPATLWVKLPKTIAWQDDIGRYGEQPFANQPIIQIDNSEGSTVALADPVLLDSSLVLDTLPIVLTGDHPFSDSAPCLEHLDTIINLTIPAFPQDYFLLVVAEQWCSLILAHHPRSVQAKPTGSPSDSFLMKELGISNSYVLTEGQTTHQHLLITKSLTGATLHVVLKRLHEGVTQQAALSGTSPEIDWDRQYHYCQTSTINPLLVTSLVLRQAQRYDDLWWQLLAYQRQQAVVESLRSQNQVLLRELQAKDEFLNNVGQELRTPLTNMKTALTLLNSPQLKPAQRQRYMQMVSTECDRQSSIITSLLELVQLDYTAEHDSLQPIALPDVIPGIVSTYQPLAQEKGLLLAYTIPDNLPDVLCLLTWLRQITINLVHNAIKFTSTGGRVWVRAKQQGDYVQIEFQDTGIGIPMQEIPKIFDRFYRVRQTSVIDVSGVGLGLTIVQQILLRCGGSISVTSRLNNGSTFNVLLPIAKSNP